MYFLFISRGSNPQSFICDDSQELEHYETEGFECYGPFSSKETAKWYEDLMLERARI
jgi:hypothetical protein